MTFNHSLILFFPLLLASCSEQPSTEPSESASESSSIQDTLRYDQEVHLHHMKQLTFGGDNAEAYWSFDSEKLVFQAGE